MEEPKKKKRRSKWDQPAPAETNSEESVDASVSAACAAARINAMLEAKGKLKNANSSQGGVAKDTAPPAEIEINDCEARGILTKGPTLSEINKATGTTVTVRGRYMTPTEKLNSTADDRPLHLHIQGPNQAFISAAVQKIRAIIFDSGTGSNKSITDGPGVTQHFVQDKVYTGLDNVEGEFNLLDKLKGPNDSFLSHISTTTGAKVYLRGKGSGYMEPQSGRESFESLYIYISHPNSEGLESARKLCESLIDHVKLDYEAFKMQYQPHPVPHPHMYPPPPPPPQVGYDPYYHHQTPPTNYGLPPPHDIHHPYPPGPHPLHGLHPYGGQAPPLPTPPNFPQVMPRPFLPRDPSDYHYEPRVYHHGYRAPPPPLPLGPPVYHPPPLVGPERPRPQSVDNLLPLPAANTAQTNQVEVDKSDAKLLPKRKFTEKSTIPIDNSTSKGNNKNIPNEIKRQKESELMPPPSIIPRKPSNSSFKTSSAIASSLSSDSKKPSALFSLVNYNNDSDSD